MPWPGATLRFALFLLVSSARPPGAPAEANVGCLFSERLCLEEIEWCFDDFAFGRCLLANGDVDENDVFRYDLQREELHELSRELRRLFALGYRWSHAYTQCRLQTMLYATKTGMTSEENACAQLIDQDLEGALKALEGEDQQLEPQEVAIVKYTPSVENPHADFADEVYYPPVGEAATLRDIILPPNAVDLMDMEDPYAQYEVVKRAWIPQMHRRAEPQSQIFTPQYNTPSNFRQGKETRDALEFLPEDPYEEFGENFEEEIPSSRPSYDILQELLERYEENERDRQADLEEQMEEAMRMRYRDQLEEENNDLPERFTLTYNTPDNFRAGWESRDVLPYEEDAGDMSEPRIYSDEDESEAYQEYGSGAQNVENSEERLFREMQGLRRSLKPFQVPFGAFLSAKHTARPVPMEEYADVGQNFEKSSDSGLYTEGGVVYAPKQKFFSDDLDELLENYEMGFKRPERLDVKKPGPFFDKEENDQDIFDTPPHPMIEKNPNRGQPNAVFIRFAERLDNWRQSNNIVNHIASLVHLDPSSITEKRVDEFGVSFRVEQNRQGLSASEVARRIELLREKLRRATGVEIAEVGVKTDDDGNTNYADNDILPAMEKKEPRGAHPNPAHDIFDVETDYVYVTFKNSISTWVEGDYIIKNITRLLRLDPLSVTHGRVDRNEVTFRVGLNRQGLNATEVARRIDFIKDRLKETTGVEVTAAGVGDKAILTSIPDSNAELYTIVFLVCGVIGAIVISIALLIVIKRHLALKEKLLRLSRPDTEASKDYQDLCRTRMATKGQAGETVHGRITSLSRESEQSPSSRSSTSSWSEEPALHNMDISTGHMVLSYMEDHLMNKDRLEQEWVALCAYVAEPCETSLALKKENVEKNRYPDVMPYDHSRVVLNELTNATGSDYINASSITDHDPRNPAYIAAQGPLLHTAPDFWQLIWEQGAVVIVMLTRLTEGGAAMCHRYWPEEGSELYHIYEVHLVSEHIWCDDYLVRSFYLKNVRTGETRTVTQFHFLSWPEAAVPASTKALLEFRRKVNKSYRGRSCPIVVHCSDGAGRTGTYCLIDMVLSRMAKGAKEIDIAATLEHLRDQRPRMVATKQQFEFVLTAVAEEVHAILKALPPQPTPVQVQAEKEKEK